MTKEQWLVYLWSIYPQGVFTQIWIVLFILFAIAIFFVAFNHFDGYADETTVWSKMGKWKIGIPSLLVIFIFLSLLIPKRDHFLLIIATPYVVDSGKSIIESLQDPNSKLYKLNKMTDKALDKVLVYLDENEKEKE